jgi:hypothetical protein
VDEVAALVLICCLLVPESFSIAQVTPHAWESGHEVNTYVE